MCPPSHAHACSYRWDAGAIKALLVKKREVGAAPLNLAAEKAELRRKLLVATNEGKTEEIMA